MEISKDDRLKINNYSNKFKIILETLAQYYDDSLNIDDLSDAAFNGMLNRLDPFSKYFTSKEWQAYNAESKGNKVGIGVQLFQLNDTINILNVIKESSAAKTGLETGDKILAIDDTNYIGKTTNQADEVLNGELNSLIKLKIKKVNDERIIDLVLPRTDFLISSISSAFIVPNTKILYLKLIRFSSKSYQEITDVLESFSGKYNSLVLDLKDNQGGSLDQVLKLTEDFTSKKDTILLLKSKSSIYDSVYVNKSDGKYNKLPVAIVINNKTASASEIFAGVIQDLDRGIVVGEISLGKGLVQRTWTYTDTSAFRITVAKYYTPSGRLIDKSHQKKNSKIKNNIDLPELELLDNGNLDEIKDMLNKINPNALMNYKSRKGRTLISFGGIFPDIFAKEMVYTKLSTILKNNGYLLSFALFYYNNNYNLFNKYTDLETFSNNYQTDENFINSFLNYIKSKNVYNEEMYNKDKEIIINFLKAYIAFFKWGDNGSYRNLLQYDLQSIETIKNIDKAIKMVN